MAYDWTKPNETLESIKTSILASMKVEEEWYVKHRRLHSIYSRTIRVVSILLFAFGILWPILSTNFSTESKPKVDIGYVSLAVGGLLLLLDKYLGISSGYVRFYIAELDIKKNTQEFIENWNIESAKATTPFTTENILNLLNTIKIFRQSVFTTIQVETGAWATEFQTQTGELYELFKQKQNEYKSDNGNISVTLENYVGYTEIELILDDKLIQRLKDGATSTIFRNVSISPHVILTRAKKEGNIVSFSKNTEVTAEKTAEVILTFPD